MQIGFPFTGYNDMRENFEERFLDAKFLHYWEVKADGGHVNITFFGTKDFI